MVRVDKGKGGGGWGFPRLRDRRLRPRKGTAIERGSADNGGRVSRAPAPALPVAAAATGVEGRSVGGVGVDVDGGVFRRGKDSSANDMGFEVRIFCLLRLFSVVLYLVGGVALLWQSCGRLRCAKPGSLVAVTEEFAATGG